MKFIAGSIKRKIIIFILFLILLTVAVLSFYSMNKLEDIMYEEKEIQLKSLMDNAKSNLEYHYHLYELGEISEQQAKLRAQEQLERTMYGERDEDYFWIKTDEPVMIMHPFAPELVGENVYDLQNEEGSYFIREMLEVVEDNGDGFVEYYWQYYDEEERSEPKLSYVWHFENWNWIVGTGIYIHDIEQSLVEMRNNIIWIGSLVVVAGLIFTYLIAVYLAEPTEIMTEEAKKIAGGSFDKKVPDELLTRKDEAGELARAFEEMRLNLNNTVKNLEERIKFEEQVAEISSRFIKTTVENYDDDINFVLQRLGEFFQIDRSFLFEIDVENKEVNYAYEWSNKNIETLYEEFESFSFSRRPWWIKKLKNFEAIYFSEIEELPEEAKEFKDDLKEQGVKSLISVPIVIEETLAGVIGFETKRYARSWEQQDISLLKIVANNISNLINKVESEKKIRYLSNYDKLTQLYSRSFLEEEIKRLDTQRQLPISIIMIDVNGLKIINDAYGHNKGDEVLKKTAEILQSSVRAEDLVARWGGDEFVILLPTTKKEQALNIAGRIEESCQELPAEKDPISLSTGVAVKIRDEQDIYQVLNKADEKMYQHKLQEGRYEKDRLVKGILETLYSSTDETENHTMRMTALAYKFGQKVGISKEDLNKLLMLVSLHDIGKVAISQEVLTKEGVLTREEWNIIKQHPERGHGIVSASKRFAYLSQYILYHQERWDGSGYPEGLRGREIPQISRMLSIIDAYEVMTGGKPYNESICRPEALKELENCAGTQFDPDLTAEFIELMEEDNYGS